MFGPKIKSFGTSFCSGHSWIGCLTISVSCCYHNLHSRHNHRFQLTVWFPYDIQASSKLHGGQSSVCYACSLQHVSVQLRPFVTVPESAERHCVYLWDFESWFFLYSVRFPRLSPCVVPKRFWGCTAALRTRPLTSCRKTISATGLCPGRNY